MLDIKYIREHVEEVKKNCENRLSSANIGELLKLDEQRRKMIGEIDAMRTEKNIGSKSKPTPEEIEAIKLRKIKMGELETELSNLEI